MKLRNSILRSFLFEAPGDEEEKEEAEEKEETEEPEEEIEPPPPGASLDAELEAVLIDFETAARKSVQSDVSEAVKVIYENEDIDNIDVSVFASETARLVKNYENLIDIESVIINKAKDFLSSRYGEESAEEFVQSLQSDHGIDVEEPKALGSEIDVPLALGARSVE